MKAMPAPMPTQNAGISAAIAPPARALIPSTRAKANRAPMNTFMDLRFELRLITASWVLSPSSAIMTRLNDASRGRKSMARAVVGSAFKDFCRFKMVKQSINIQLNVYFAKRKVKIRFAN